MSSRRDTSKNEIDLIVEPAKQRDVGKKFARIPKRIMRELGVESGDFIGIKGPKGVVYAQVMPGYTEDEDRNIIRIDGYIRESLGVGVGDIVRVFPEIKIPEADKVVLVPMEPVEEGGFIPFIGTIQDYMKNVAESLNEYSPYIKQQLLNKPLSRGEIVAVPIHPTFGRIIKFFVRSTSPSNVVYVSENTDIVIRYEPIEEIKKTLEGIPRVTWEDIGDLEEVKERLREIVELPMRHPEIFRHLGIEPPKGILLYGPPGVGKTLLAKALANEVGAYFIAINGPEIMSKFYGESEQRLREIFEEARKNAPAIIFIDEIDAIAPKRSEVIGEVEKRVVAQLLTLMDGLQGRGDVIVIGATNRIHAVDPALRRPGRFDREIEIPLPDKSGRLEILRIHTRNVPLDSDVDLEKLAEMTHGYTGADIAALVKEAALRTIRRTINIDDLDRDNINPEILDEIKVSMADFLEAYKEIIPSGLREVYIEIPDVRWSDIGGLEDVKQELRESIEWAIKSPQIYKRLGIEPPKGILLYGPPGVGKTLLGKAIANESGAHMIWVKGPELLSKWVGESERAIREIFRKARLYSPAIIFFDEIDALFPIRGMFSEGTHVMESIVSQLLAEIDGIDSMKNVFIIGATNRPDLIDPALFRPGRFDKLIYVPPPDLKSRIEIFKVHTRKMPLAEDVDLEYLARMTEGYTGADISALVREAGLTSLREDINATRVELRHFLKALEKIRPSITEDMIRFYENWGLKAKQKLPRKTISTTMYS
ncbi:MAG: CDC48 family AAA ATPase [Sulfolobales archaeon]